MMSENAHGRMRDANIETQAGGTATGAVRSVSGAIDWQELDHLFENATIGIHWVAPDGLILRANRAELEMLGYEASEYVGRHIADFHVDRDVIDDMLKRLVQGETLRDRPARLQCKDGSTREVLINSSALVENGQLIHTRCFTLDISELRRGQEAQARLAAIVETSDDAIISKGLDGTILTWNAGAERLFGYSASEAVGQRITLIVPEELYQEEEAILQRLRRGEQIAHYETARMSKDGRRIPISLTVSPIRDPLGRITGASKVARDIGHRKRQEEALGASQAQFEAETAALSRLTEVSSRLWRMQTLHEGLDEMLAATIELLGADFGNVQLLDDRRKVLLIAAHRGFEQEFLDFFQEVAAEHDSACGRALRTAEQIIVEDVETDALFQPLLPMARKAGFRAVQSTPLVGRDGRPLGMLSTYFRTPHHPSPQDLRRLDLYVRQAADFIERSRIEELLREREERLRLALHAGRMGTWDWDIRSNTVKWSPTLEEIHGLRSGSFAGTLSAFEEDIHPADRQRITESLAKTLQENKEHHIEYRIVRPDGTVRWVEGNGALVRDDLGGPTHMIGVCTDVTEHKRAEEMIRALLRICERLNSTLDTNTLLDILVQEAITIVGGESGVSGLNTPAGMECRKYFQRGKALPFEYRWPPMHGLPGWLIVHKIPYLTNNAMADKQIVHEVCVQFGVRSALSTPIVSNNGQVLGFFEIHNKEGGFSGADKETLLAVSHSASIAIQNAIAFRRLEDAERSTRESEERFARFMEHLPGLAWIKDLCGRYVFANDAAERAFRTPRAQLYGRTDEEIFAPATAAVFHENDRRAAASGSGIQTVETLEQEDGVHHSFVHKFPIPERDGQVGWVGGMAIDITERIRAEEALRESEFRYRAVVESQAEMVCRFQPDGRILFVNGAYASARGTTPEALVGGNLWDFITSDDRAEVKALLASVTPEAPEVRIENRFETVDGERWTLWTNRALRFNDERQPEELQSAGIDITDRKRAEEALRRANEALRRANTDLEQFAYSASHDLQEPIRNISLSTQILAKRYGHMLDDKALELLSFATEGAKRMEMLVKGLLSFTRSAQERSEADEAADANAAVRKALSNLSAAIEESNAAITVDVLPTVPLGEVQLQQIFQNLILNAIKYRSDGDTPRIHIGAMRTAADWLFSVRDNGIGIPTEYHERVFGLFKRLHGSAKYSGAGIGLAICQRIVERSGGRIWVESEGAGKGSTFYFTLPVDDGSAHEGEQR